MHFQIGFNRRYATDFQAAKKTWPQGLPAAAAPALADAGSGTGSIPHAARVPAWTIFLETLIHDSTR